MSSLLVLMDHHKRLEAIFLEHQVALIGVDLDLARERLATWTAALFAHMQHEETKILPRYALLPRVRGGGVEFYTGEHQRVRELIEEVTGLVTKLDAKSATVK